MPPPELPKPPVNAFAVPTTFLSKKPVDQTWQGTKLPPRMPTKKRIVRRPLTLLTVPARAVGIAPRRRQPAKVYLGPNLSQDGPATRRTSSLSADQNDVRLCRLKDTYVAQRATILEFWMSFGCNFKSFAMVTESCWSRLVCDDECVWSGTYQWRECVPGDCQKKTLNRRP